MGWEDRPYYRNHRGGLSANPIIRALSGSVPLFTAFGIRVRMHATLIVLIACVILLDFHSKIRIQDRALFMGCLAVVVILHEFGHCFAARSVGGTADDILLWPLGGLAFANPPHQPWATFWTVACGPLVNVGLCIVTAAGYYFFTPRHLVSLNPFSVSQPLGLGFSDPALYFSHLFFVSYILLLFNLLPIFPLDGGQMLQSILWPRLGYFRSMNIATIVGMAGGALLIAFGLIRLDLNLVGVGIVGIWFSRQRRMMLLEMGQESWSGSGIDYGASIYEQDEPRRKRKGLNSRAINRARKIAREESAQRNRIDAILAKVSAHGMHSLTWSERRTLRKATERQRKHELEMSKYK